MVNLCPDGKGGVNPRKATGRGVEIKGCLRWEKMSFPLKDLGPHPQGREDSTKKRTCKIADAKEKTFSSEGSGR